MRTKTITWTREGVLVVCSLCAQRRADTDEDRDAHETLHRYLGDLDDA